MADHYDTKPLPGFAPQWLAQWRTAAARLEELDLQELREMTEADAARIFAQLDPPRPYELRPTSGLVEQQRLFSLLRASTSCAEDPTVDPEIDLPE